MSNFDGIIKELPGIIIDNFLKENYEYTCFFISHCHTDHMKGLFDEGFVELLNEKADIFLYCSTMTKLILKNYEELSKVRHKITDVVGTTTLEIPGDPSYQVTVTSIPAGHCPGSLMFLFETSNNTILYTGDFRIAKGDTSKFRQLHDGKYPKRINTIYLDATFCSKKYMEFPSRSESIAEIIKWAKEHLEASKDNEVVLHMPARYGGEAILVEVSKALRQKICVEKSTCELYRHVPEISWALTDKSDTTRIHVFSKDGHAKKYTGAVRNIKPCAISFKCYDVTNMKRSWQSPRMIKINYSSHCSYSEILDFLNYLQPDNIVVCTDIAGIGKNNSQNIVPDLLYSWKEPPISKRRRLITRDELSKPLTLRISTNSDMRLDLESPPISKKTITKT